jgi:hypothetical protein
MHIWIIKKKINKGLTLIGSMLTDISGKGETQQGNKFANKWGQAWN